jgi:hypothetical protein
MSSGGGTRTHNITVNSRALCQLSYPGSTVLGYTANNPF